jgi:hypothetical protein
LRASCIFPSGSRLLPARFSEFARNPEDPTLAALGLLGYSSLSAGTSALEISSRNAHVQALQKRWDRLRAGLDLVLDQWGADTSDLPWGASGLLVRGYKGKKADRLVTRIDPGVVSLVAELRYEPQGHRGIGPVEDLASRSASSTTPRRRTSPRQEVQWDHPGSMLSFVSGSAIKRITAGVRACRWFSLPGLLRRPAFTLREEHMDSNFGGRTPHQCQRGNRSALSNLCPPYRGVQQNGDTFGLPIRPDVGSGFVENGRWQSKVEVGSLRVIGIF